MIGYILVPKLFSRRQSSFVIRVATRTIELRTALWASTPYAGVAGRAQELWKATPVTSWPAPVYGRLHLCGKLSIYYEFAARHVATGAWVLYRDDIR